jgi:hypothetical protein
MLCDPINSCANLRAVTSLNERPRLVATGVHHRLRQIEKLVVEPSG